MRRWLLLGVIAAAIVVATKLIIENVLGIDLQPAVERWIAHPGPGAAAAVVLLLIVDLFLPVPSSLVMVLSGAAFGVTRGAALSLAGSLGCSILGFELARRFGRGAAARLVGHAELVHLERTFERYGAGAVFVSRALPIMLETMSMVAGLSRMRRPVYLAATVAGTIPEVLLYAYAGAASREMGSIMPAVVILIALSGAGWMLFKNRQRADLR